ncbi:transcriptional regulator domain-containing protein, partial [Xanthobacter flavus]
MKPDTSRWREDASYGYFDALSVEGLAWECLRRDEAYQDHYQSLVT